MLYSNSKIDEISYQLSELDSFIINEKTKTKNFGAAISLLSSHKNILNFANKQTSYAKTNFKHNQEQIKNLNIASADQNHMTSKIDEKTNYKTVKTQNLKVASNKRHKPSRNSTQSKDLFSEINLATAVDDSKNAKSTN